MRRVPVAGPTVSLMGAGVDLVDGTLSLLAIHQLCWVRATYYEQRILHTPLTWGSLATGAHWYWIRPFDHPAPNVSFGCVQSFVLQKVQIRFTVNTELPEASSVIVMTQSWD